MSFSQWLLLNVPTIVIGLVILVISVGFAVGGVLLVRRCIPPSKLKSHHDIAGPIFSTLGVIYAVLLGFTTIVVWQDFNDANTTLVKEANYYSDIYRDMSGLSAAFREKADTAMDAYIDALINDEWQIIDEGKRSEKVQVAAQAVWELYGSYEPKTETEKIFLAESIRKMDEAGEMRRQRLMDAQAGLNPVLWFAIIVGGIITITFTFFFGSENLTLQLIMTILLSALIALVLFTILAMDFPFTGDFAIKPDALVQMLIHLKN